MQALLVIDMLEDFFIEPPLADVRSALCARINALVAAWRLRGLPIIWVRQEFEPDLSDAFLGMRKTGTQKTIAGTPGCQILHELSSQPSDHEIVKKRYSAFFGTGLDALLAELGVDHVVLCGINTHACVRMAAIDAYQRDLEVTVVSDCVDSWDPEHHRVTLAYLGRLIATVGPASQVVGGG